MKKGNNWTKQRCEQADGWWVTGMLRFGEDYAYNKFGNSVQGGLSLHYCDTYLVVDEY